MPSDRFHEMGYVNVIDLENNIHFIQIIMVLLLKSEETASAINSDPNKRKEINWVEWKAIIEAYENKNKSLSLFVSLFLDKYPDYRDILSMKGFTLMDIMDN
uniref:Uncharacterized protein n=1 Tax=Euplotes harpa TaxID=151035 RepID=A0A7S3J9M9_9SPIT|mmetsp:Transcript_27923/g.32026  ORF Transcript_27923/g.32026 Transcript_27923/m.32026 type:complete len:102 (+) Transcript_27923:225-530(+)